MNTTTTYNYYYSCIAKAERAMCIFPHANDPHFYPAVVPSAAMFGQRKKNGAGDAENHGYQSCVVHVEKSKISY